MPATVAKPAPAVLDVHDVAELLGISERHVYRQVEEGNIPAPRKFGALNKWPRAQFEKWIEAGCPVPSAQK